MDLDELDFLPVMAVVVVGDEVRGGGGEDGLFRVAGIVAAEGGVENLACNEGIVGCKNSGGDVGENFPKISTVGFVDPCGKGNGILTVVVESGFALGNLIAPILREGEVQAMASGSGVKLEIKGDAVAFDENFKDIPKRPKVLAVGCAVRGDVVVGEMG